MLAVFMTRQGLQMKDIPPPRPGEDELLVRMTGVGVCSSDVSTYKIQTATPQALAAVTDYPIGHDGSGIVVETGKNVRGFQPGDAVTCCAGTISELFVVSASDACLVPESLHSWEVLGEPAACCVYAARHFGFLSGRRAAVVGCGFMGQLCIQLLAAMGAVDILAIDPVAERRALALRYGASRTLAPDEAGSQEDGRYALVIEAAGNEAAVTLSSRMVQEHGVLSLVGYHLSDGGKRQVDMQAWNYKAITVSNGHVRDSREKWDALCRTVSLYAAGKLDTREMVTYYPIGDAPTAFLDMVNHKDRLIKACVVSESVWQQLSR